MVISNINPYVAHSRPLARLHSVYQKEQVTLKLLTILQLVTF